jgi:hypothetical protein
MDLLLALVLTLAPLLGPHKQAPVIAAVERQVAPYVKLPASVSLDPTKHVMVKLVADTNCKTLKWSLASDVGDLIVADSGAWAIFALPGVSAITKDTPTKYLILCWGASGDVPTDAAQCWVVLSGPAPPVPPPPAPPAPVPPPAPAEPTDEWYPPLKTVFLTEPATDKTKVATVAAVWRQAAAAVQTDTSPTLIAFLNTVIAPAMTSAVGSSLTPTRKQVAALLDKALPVSSGAALDVTTRPQCAAAFTRIAVCLEALANLQKR